MAQALVVVGGSLGGFQAVKELLAGLPTEFPVPLAVVLHRAASVGNALPALLQRHSQRPVVEAEDKAPILPGRVHLAPTGYHLLVEPGRFALSTDPPVRFARPSIDLLFESAADAYADRVVGLVLTGSSADGAAGLATIKRRGGLAIVQDPSTAESAVLPDAALASTEVDRVLPVAAIATFLVERCSHLLRS